MNHVIDASPFRYEVQAQQPDGKGGYKLETVSEDYPFPLILRKLLRSEGCWKNGPEVILAVVLGKKIADNKGDELVLTDEEYHILKHCLNYHIGNEKNPFGGEVHEEMILRVFQATKTEDGNL